MTRSAFWVHPGCLMRCGSLRPALLCLQKPPDVSERHMSPGKFNYPWNKDPCWPGGFGGSWRYFLQEVELSRLQERAELQKERGGPDTWVWISSHNNTTTSSAHWSSFLPRSGIAIGVHSTTFCRWLSTPREQPFLLFWNLSLLEGDQNRAGAVSIYSLNGMFRHL